MILGHPEEAPRAVDPETRAHVVPCDATRGAQPAGVFARKSDVIEAAGGLRVQRKGVKNTNQMTCGAEKSISSEIDNLMTNCDRIHVNNITRKRLCRILI